MSQSPYKGLQPYGEKDREFFFGRETDREVIISNLFAAPLTIFYGASGVGKSSVLLAGVVPELRETKRVVVVVFREWQDPGFENALKQEVIKAIDFGGQTEPDLSLELDEFLFVCGRQFRGSLFFILDQFEEYFLYHPVSRQIDRFDAAFARTINRTDINANFLLSMRDDGLGKLDRFQKRIPNLLNNMLRLEHLGRRSAEMAIRKPLQKYNEQLTGEQPRAAIEDGLVNVLLEDLQTGKVTLDLTGQGKVGSRIREDQTRGIETPFLQVVLTRLWEEESRVATANNAELKLRLKTYESLGRATQVVRTHLDKIMETDRLRPHRDTAAAIFHFLVTPTGMKIAHRVGDLASYAKRPEPDVRQALNELSAPDVRILRPITQPGIERYEIFHDVLAPAILDWRQRYQKILDQEELKQQRARAEKEARSAKLFRRVSIALGAVCLIALIAIGAATVFYLKSRELNAASERYKKEGEEYKQDGVRLRVEGDFAKAAALLAQAAADNNDAKAAAAQRTANHTQHVADETQARADRAERQSEIRARQIDLANLELKKSQDEVRNEQLYRDAFRLSRNYSQGAEAIDKFNQVLNHYRTNNNTESLLPALFDAGRLYVEMRQFDEANSLFDEALTQSLEPAGQAATLGKIGDLYRDVSFGSPDTTKRSEEAYKRAIEIYQQLGDVNSQAMIRLSRAQGRANRAIYSFRDPSQIGVENAMKEFEAVAEFARSQKLPDIEGLVWMTAAEIIARRYDEETPKKQAVLFGKARHAYASASNVKAEIKALTLFIGTSRRIKDETAVAKGRADLIELCQKANDLICEAGTVNDLVNERLFPLSGENRGVLELASRSRQLYFAAFDRKNNTTDELQQIGDGLYSLGITYALSGDRPASLEITEKARLAYRLSKKHHNQFFKILDSLVGLNYQMGKLTEAQNYLKEAIEESQHLNQAQEKISALTQIGIHYSDLKNDEMAASNFDTALREAREYDNTIISNWQSEVEAVQRIGDYLINKKQLDKARHYFDYTLSKQRPPSLQLQVVKRIANIYYNDVYVSRELLDTALAYFESAMTIAHSLSPSEEGYVLLDMAKVFRTRGSEGDTAKADDCQRRANDLIKSTPSPSPSPNLPQSQKP